MIYNVIILLYYSSILCYTVLSSSTLVCYITQVPAPQSRF